MISQSSQIIPETSPLPVPIVSVTVLRMGQEARTWGGQEVAHPLRQRRHFSYTEGIGTKLLIISFQKVVEEIVCEKLAVGVGLIIGG